MTTNEPFAPVPDPADPADHAGTAAPTEPLRPVESEAPAAEPSWGSAPSAPPAGAGSDHPATDGTTFTAAGSTGPGSAGSSTPPGARFFDAVRRLGIVRPDEGRWGPGVAAGIARRYHLDPVVVRIAFAVLTLLGGLGLTLYALGWLFLPHPDGRIHAQQVLTGTVTAGFVGAFLAVLITTHEALPLFALAAVIFIVVRHRRTSRPTVC